MSEPESTPSSCCTPPDAEASSTSSQANPEDASCCESPPAKAPVEKTTPPQTIVSCCGEAVTVPGEPSDTKSTPTEATWIEGSVDTPVSPIPGVCTELRFEDRIGSWKARWGIGRMGYIVEPGLYAVGSPTADSPVLVSANYKMSFDRLRSQLSGHDTWILVLDTRGINVWCAAGKGTFGSDEIVRRVVENRLVDVVSHRKLIVPQLGAPGVSAPKVKALTGFRVVYGPVRARDLPAFLDAGMKATPEMRRVEFPMRDRIVLIPVELVMAAKYAALVALVLVLLSGFGPGVFSVDRLLTDGPKAALLFLGVCIAAVVLTPALLPWLPGRPFSLKGVWIGLGIGGLAAGYGWTHPGFFAGALSGVACLLALPAVASFLAMNFTGASTYTSLSGVRREMRVAVPLQLAGAVLGLTVWIGGRFV